MVSGLRNHVAVDNVAVALQRRYLAKRFDVLSNGIRKDSQIKLRFLPNDEPERRSLVL
jgi:hypothetical protein